MTAARCEVRLAALRRTKDGTIVSLLIHPNDVPDCFSLDPLGQRYMIGIAAIGDDEQPLQSTMTTDLPPLGDAVSGDCFDGDNGYVCARAPAKNAAIVKRAGILSSDKRFWSWINVADAEAAAAFIRRACAVESRRDLATNTGAAIRFQGLLDEFEASTGRRAEMRG